MIIDTCVIFQFSQINSLLIIILPMFSFKLEHISIIILYNSRSSPIIKEKVTISVFWRFQSVTQMFEVTLYIHCGLLSMARVFLYKLLWLSLYCVLYRSCNNISTILEAGIYNLMIAYNLSCELHSHIATWRYNII